MAKFIISKKLTVAEAVEGIRGIEQWFADNPRSKVCNTDTFSVRRGFTGTDVFSHTDLKDISKNL